MPVFVVEMEYMDAHSEEADEDAGDASEEVFKGFAVEEFEGDTGYVGGEEGSENSESHYESCEEG